MNRSPRSSRLAGLCALAAAALLSLGCDTINTVERAEPQAQPTVVEDKRIITDGDVADEAHVVEIREGRVSGDMLKIQAEILNTTSRPQNVNYKFEWLDANGFILEGPTSTWRTVRFMGKERRSITGVATSPQAVDFRLKLKEGK